jgi:hypothetical protein
MPGGGALAVFHVPATATSQQVEAEVTVHERDVDADLRLASGDRLQAAYIYVPAGY